MDAFEKLFGYRSSCFIPTNGPFNNSLEVLTAKGRVKYTGTAKYSAKPLGNGAYKKHFRYIGKRNHHGPDISDAKLFFSNPIAGRVFTRQDWAGTV
jgi:hypothetical protein